MELEQINNRLNDLSAVITYDFLLEKKHFTPGEKIAINQERGALTDRRYVLNCEMHPGKERKYRISEALEKKVQFVLNKIKNENNK